MKPFDSPFKKLFGKVYIVHDVTDGVLPYRPVMYKVSNVESSIIYWEKYEQAMDYIKLHENSERMKALKLDRHVFKRIAEGFERINIKVSLINYSRIIETSSNR